MSTALPPAYVPAEMPAVPIEALPNIDHIQIEDGQPLDGIYRERQMHLLKDALAASWGGPPDGRSHVALVNVGMFYSTKRPPLVPDFLLSVGVEIGDVSKKENNSYFFWIMGKPPDLVLEIVSNKEGGELEHKRLKYAELGIKHYIVWDPQTLLSVEPLTCLRLNGDGYAVNGPWFPQLGLGFKTWEGAYQSCHDRWLRWCDKAGQLLPTGVERAERERGRAEAEHARAETERARAESLASKLRSLGVDPNS